MRNHWIGLLLLVALIASGCGSSSDNASEVSSNASAAEADAGDDGSGDSAGADGGSDGQAADDETESDSDSDSASSETGPLTELLGFGGSEDEQNARFEAEERDRQEIIARCMAEQGFDYVPIDPGQFAFFGDLDEDAFGEQYGYGISTTFEDSFDGSLFGEDFVDPNQEIVEAMSEGERDAYYEALYGDIPEFDSTVESDDDGFFEPSGCEGEAYSQGSFGQIDEFFEEFGDELEAMEARFNSDPRIVEATTAWSTCMSDAGYPFDRPDDIYEALQAEMEPFYDRIFSNQDFDDLPADPDAEFSEPEDIEFEVPTLDAESQALLDDLQARELAIYAADQACQGDLEAIGLEVQFELEAEFVEANEARITAVLGD